MSTRSRIAIQNKDLSITSIYCHHDGYIQKGVGVAYDLHKHYQDGKKVQNLIDLGGISGLGEQVHSGSTTAYGRDLNSSELPLESKDLQDLWEFFKNSDQEYLYLFKDKQWHYVKSENETIPLSELV